MPERAETYSFQGVAVLRPGEFIALDGTRVSFTEDDLAAIADSYNPGWHPATVNIDHRHDGPALGHITALSFDGEFLRADICGVDSALAERIDAGAFPFRSAEVYSDLDGRGMYLRAVALLGAKSPAVRGLPPMPGGVKQAEQHMENRRPLAWGPIPRRTGTVISVKAEVAMSTKQGNGEAGGADAVMLAEENQRLAAENRRLRREEQRRSVALFMSGLRDAGKLTPAIEQSGIEQALVSAEEGGAVVQLADGGQKPLAQVLREVLEALPAVVELGERAPVAEPDRPRLTPDEEQIARQLGLSADELLEIKAAG